MLASRILGPVDALVLQRGEERLGHRIIVAYPGTADGLPEIKLFQRLRELLGRVVATAVGIKPNSVNTDYAEADVKPENLRMACSGRAC